MTDDLSARQLNKDIAVPLYHQLKEHLRSYISRCSDGDLIPTELELCRHFEVSRPTVRQAVTELVSEGLLQRNKRQGTFVTKGKVHRDFLLTFERFDYEMQAAGRRPATHIRSVETDSANDRVAAALGIGTGVQVYEIKRVRFLDDTPLVAVTNYLPADLLPDLLKHKHELQALHHMLEHVYGYRLHRARRKIEAVAASESRAWVLDVQVGAPLQYIETQVYLESGRCIEFARAWYRGDMSS
ncbi:MAG: GntR family transcriptional regulator, partial [Spirochaetaceae bacterium]